MLKLLVTAGPAVGGEIEVDDEFEVGRHSEGAGKLGGDRELSRRHARIARTAAGGYTIEDLGSLNGTVLSGRRIEAVEALSVNDAIEVGASTLLVERIHVVEPTPDAPTPDAPETADEEQLQTEAPASRPQDTVVPAAEQPAVELRVEVDFEARRASVRLDGDGDAVELEHRDGAWRVRAS